MSNGAQARTIRVLYLGRGPDQHAFTLRLLEGSPDISLTTTTQPEELGKILRGGYNCLVIEEGKPYIDAAKITRLIKSEGFSRLPIIVHKGEDRGDEDVRRLAEAIRSARWVEQEAPGEKRGLTSSPIG